MTTAELDIINRMRGEVYGHRVPTGENLFLVWGYLTAFFLLIEFAALMLWKEKSCVSVPRRCAALSARRSPSSVSSSRVTSGRCNCSLQPLSPSSP